MCLPEWMAVGGRGGDGVDRERRELGKKGKSHDEGSEKRQKGGIFTEPWINSYMLQ